MAKTGWENKEKKEEKRKTSAALNVFAADSARIRVIDVVLVQVAPEIQLVTIGLARQRTADIRSIRSTALVKRSAKNDRSSGGKRNLIAWITRERHCLSTLVGNLGNNECGVFAGRRSSSKIAGNAVKRRSHGTVNVHYQVKPADIAQGKDEVSRFG